LAVAAAMAYTAPLRLGCPEEGSNNDAKLTGSAVKARLVFYETHG